MNTDCDYSSAYVKLYTDSDLTGFGMTFTIGRGNDIVCMAIQELSKRLVGKETEEIFANMGKTWDYLSADSQLRWYVPILHPGCNCSVLSPQDRAGKGRHSHRLGRGQQRAVGHVCTFAQQATVETRC